MTAPRDDVASELLAFARFLAGLPRLVRRRMSVAEAMAIVQFVLAGVLWFFLLGWAIHLWSVLDAALWKPKTV